MYQTWDISASPKYKSRGCVWQVSTRIGQETPGTSWSACSLIHPTKGRTCWTTLQPFAAQLTQLSVSAEPRKPEAAGQCLDHRVMKGERGSYAKLQEAVLAVMEGKAGASHVHSMHEYQQIHPVQRVNVLLSHGARNPHMFLWVNVPYINTGCVFLLEMAYSRV